MGLSGGADTDAGRRAQPARLYEAAALVLERPDRRGVFSQQYLVFSNQFFPDEARTAY